MAPTVDTVRITRLNGHVAIEPANRLGSEKFAAYRAAIEGAKFNAADRCNEAPVALVPSIAARLKAAGFVVDLDDAARAAIESARAATTVAVQAAASRADTINRALEASGLALFPFQREGVAWLAGRSAALLADPMGLGKTVQTLCAMPDGAPVLVVAPAVAKGVWKREAARFRPDIRVTVLSGRGSFRWPTAGEMVVVNFDILPAVVEDGKGFKLDATIPAPPAGCVLVVDEAHADQKRQGEAHAGSCAPSPMRCASIRRAACGSSRRRRCSTDPRSCTRSSARLASSDRHSGRGSNSCASSAVRRIAGAP